MCADTSGATPSHARIVTPEDNGTHVAESLQYRSASNLLVNKEIRNKSQPTSCWTLTRAHIKEYGLRTNQS